MIIGVTGRVGAGKRWFSAFLREEGFKPYAFRDVVVEEARSRGMDLTRENLQNLGENMAKGTGGVIWAERLIDRIKVDKINYVSNFVVEGFRYPQQAKKFYDSFGERGFYFVAIDATPKIRYERIKHREEIEKRLDPTDWEGFVRMDERDWKGCEKGNGQNVRDCFKMAQRKIRNDTNMADFYGNTMNFLEEAKRKLILRCPMCGYE